MNRSHRYHSISQPLDPARIIRLTRHALDVTGVGAFLRGLDDEWREIFTADPAIDDPERRKDVVDLLPHDRVWSTCAPADEPRFASLDLDDDAAPHRVASAPLVVPQTSEMVGLLVVTDNRPGRGKFSDDDIQSLTDLADAMVDRLEAQMASERAVENARRFEELSERLAQRQRRFQTLVDLLPVFVIVKDRQGNTLLSNKAHSEAAGYRSGAIVGHDFREYVGPPEVAEAMAAADRHVIDTGRTLRTQREVIFNGKPLTVDVIKVKYEDWEPGVDAVLGVVSDITELKEHQRQLAQKRQELEQMVDALRRSNRALEQYAYVASHDLQEPLRMISGFLGLLEEEYSDQLDEEAREYIGYAIDGAQRMRAMINALLTHSRIHTSHEPYQRVELEPLLERVSRNIRAANADLDVEITRDDLPDVWGRESQLERLFANLLSNAVKYRGEGEAHVEIRAETTADVHRIYVEDHGMGIAPSQHQRIFDIFVRGSAAQSVTGTGIGLAVCHSIVEEHGGRIWVESDPGNGATFIFEIPREPQAPRST